MWLFFAISSAVFAAATAIFAKIGIEQVDANLATAIRTTVVLIMAWGIVFIAHSIGHSSTSLLSAIAHISSRSWIFLILSGLATGASWICYFYAIKLGEVSKVVPIDKCSLVLTILFAVIFLGESLSWKTAIGCILLLAGSLIMIIYSDKYLCLRKQSTYFRIRHIIRHYPLLFVIIRHYLLLSGIIRH